MSLRRRRVGVPATLLALSTVGAVLLAGCSSDDPGADASAPTSASTPAVTPSAGATSSGSPGSPESPSTPDASATAAPGPAATPQDPQLGRVAPQVGTETLAPVPAGTPARTEEGFSASLTSSAPVELTASGPGEVAGPGVLLDISFTNGADFPVGLDGVRVTATLADGTPAPATDASPSAPATGLLQPGGSASGRYAFSLPTGAPAGSDLLVQITTVSSAQVLQVRS
ncbi:hypothetical protein ACFFKU_06205 [Kineococcus gynurae]|uniref:DUF4352 domain-containing protein n=1 Tax=Kineococcus gynurae TaxID=452979 RepID=A0ABV5LXT7_9ACTN